MDAYNVGSRPKKRKRLGVDNFENDDEAHGEAKPSHLDSCMNEVDGKILLKCPNHAAEVLTGLERLLQDKRLCDVIVQVGDSEFHAHRVVLAASSDMLRALLIGGWKETDKKAVKLEGVDARSFETILNFIYTSQVVVEDVTELLHLLVASEHLDVHAVRDLCVQRLQQRLDLPNALQMRLFAQKVGCIELEDAASEVVWGQFSQVVAAGNDFLSLDCQQLSQILSSDKLCVDSEEEVFHAVMKWVKHDESRLLDLPLLLSYVRLPMLEPAVLERTQKNALVAGVFRNSSNNRRLLEEARAFHADMEAHHPSHTLEEYMESSSAMRQRPPRVGKALFALGGRPAWTRVEKYEVRLNQWIEVSGMSQKRMRHGSATIGGLIYVVGGKDDTGRALSSVERYNPHMDSWETMPPLQTSRTGVGVGVLAGMLYAVGGRHDSGYRLKTVECFNVQTQEWEYCPEMREARGALRVAALDGFLYVVGGRSESGAAIASVERYNPVAEQWTNVSPMRNARVGAGLEVLNGKLYAVGGKDEKGSKLRSVERFDPKGGPNGLGQWEHVSPMGTKRWGAGVAVLDGKLFVIGGMNGAERGALPTVEVYDPSTETWSELSPGPKLARGSCTFAAA